MTEKKPMSFWVFIILLVAMLFTFFFVLSSLKDPVTQPTPEPIPTSTRLPARR